jgi:hypothetical protein
MLEFKYTVDIRRHNQQKTWTVTDPGSFLMEINKITCRSTANEFFQPV